MSKDQFRLPSRSQTPFGNARAEAIALPISPLEGQPKLARNEISRGQEAFPSTTWERGDVTRNAISQPPARAILEERVERLAVGLTRPQLQRIDPRLPRRAPSDIAVSAC